MGFLLIIIVAMTLLSFAGGHWRLARAQRYKNPQFTVVSRPFYGGLLSALWCLIPCVILITVWLFLADSVIHQRLISELPDNIQAFPPEELELVLALVDNLIAGYQFDIPPQDYVVRAAAEHRRLSAQSDYFLFLSVLTLGSMTTLLCWILLPARFNARHQVESVFQTFLLLSASVAVLTTAGIILSVLFESLQFFQAVSLSDFLFGTTWSPQAAVSVSDGGSLSGFGVLPLFLGTLIIAAMALLVAIPVGLLSAIYLSEYASGQMRTIVKPALEILAGIPTVVYGFFAALTIAPLIRSIGDWLTGSWAFELLGLSVQVSAESALAAGLVMGVMIIPYISSLTDDILLSVPASLKEGALALGATRSEMMKQVVLPAALPGISAGILLAASRAIGETMIVVMAAGLAARLSVNPLDSLTTVTVQIVSLLSGDQIFDSPKTLSAFALGLLLFTLTLILNLVALRIVRRFRERYE